MKQKELLIKKQVRKVKLFVKRLPYGLYIQIRVSKRKESSSFLYFCSFEKSLAFKLQKELLFKIYFSVIIYKCESMLYGVAVTVLQM